MCAKANQKVTKKDLKLNIDKGFDAWEGGFREFKKAAEKCKMDLLVKSIDMDIAVLDIYRKGWNKLREE